jgi:hypothetical protein
MPGEAIPQKQWLTPSSAETALTNVSYSFQNRIDDRVPTSGVLLPRQRARRVEQTGLVVQSQYRAPVFGQLRPRSQPSGARLMAEDRARCARVDALVRFDYL